MNWAILLASLLCPLLIPSPAGASILSFDRLYVFGDSLSDNGNAYFLSGGIVPQSPPNDRRFSNGPVAVERLAANLGIDLAPSLQGGTDYAIGGATTGTDNFIPFFSGTGIRNQVELFTDLGPGAGFNPATALFVVWGGANDFFLGASRDTIGPAVDNLAQSIADLAHAGAEHILVPNLPNLGATPFGLAQGPAIAAGLTTLTELFNQTLAQRLVTLGSTLMADLIPFDTFAVLNEVLQNPASYGFLNVSDACLSHPACDPGAFLFWSDVHPTARGHAILGDEFAAALVPLPASAPLLLAGMASFYLVRRFANSRA